MFALLVLVLATTCAPGETSFNATAETEIFRFRPGGVPTSGWMVTNARIYDDNGGQRAFSGTIRWRDSVWIQVERISTGPLVIRAEAEAEGTPAATLLDEGEEFAGSLPGRVTVVIDSIEARSQRGENVALFFAARDAQLGERVGFRTTGYTPVLRRGTVHLLGLNPVTKRRFEAGSANLETGDELTIANPATPFTGLLVVDERPGFTTVVRVRAKVARISRGGADGYSLATSWFEALTSDPVLRVCWAILLFLFGAAGWFMDRAQARQK